MGYVGDRLQPFFDSSRNSLLMRELANKGGDTMVDWTVRNTPIDTGNLRTSWYQLDVNKRITPLGDTWESGVATQVEYAPYVEHGTGLWGPDHARYTIRPKDPHGWLRWRDRATGRWVYAKAVQHPGSPGQHMVAIAAAMTEAEFERVADPILEAWRREIEARAR